VEFRVRVILTAHAYSGRQFAHFGGSGV
jgi:hypothetical protein